MNELAKVPGVLEQPASGSNEPYSGRLFTLVVLLMAVSMAAVAALWPFASIAGPQTPIITPVFASVIIITEMTTSFLLFVWFSEGRKTSLLLLACAYLYGAMMAAFHVLTFPEAVLPGQTILGSGQSTAWIFLLWTLGYAVLTMAAVLVEATASGHRVATARVPGAIAASVVAMVAVVLAVVYAATALVDRLPPLMAGSSWTRLNQVINYTGLIMMMMSIIMILARVGRRNKLFLWLGLAITTMVAAQLLGLSGGGRYSVGWTLGRLSWSLSACILFVFFMAQFVRQQHSLARARATLEERVKERTSDLERAIGQRDLLLREVYHRVKNNLQVMDGLVDMERRRLTDTAARDALGALRSRIFTLGLVHQQLMSSSDMATVQVAPFLEELAGNLELAIATDQGPSRLRVEADAVPVSIDFAIPIGLITTELVSKAMKNAASREIRISFHRSADGHALLEVADAASVEAGGGSSGSAGLLDGTGRRIVEGLVHQLGGQMNVTHDRGTRVAVRVPLSEAA